MRSREAKVTLILAVILIVALPHNASAETAWVDDTLTLAPGDYYPYAYYCDGKGDITFTLCINVTSGDPISLIMMNQWEYNDWSSGRPASYLHYGGIRNSVFNFTVPRNYDLEGYSTSYRGNYYLILHNSESSSWATVKVTITYWEPQSVDTSWIFVLLFGAVGAVMVLFLVLCIKYSRQ